MRDNLKNSNKKTEKTKTEEDLRRKNRKPEKKDGDRENPDDDHKMPSFPENSNKFKRGSLKPNEDCNGEKGCLGFAFSL